jgi:hypothetical protein
MAEKRPDPGPVEPREFKSADEIDAAIMKLNRRIRDLERPEVTGGSFKDTDFDRVVISDVRETICDVFGTNSPEFREYQYIRLWAGPTGMILPKQEVHEYRERGRQRVIAILKGLISRLEEKKEDLGRAGAASTPSTYFDRLRAYPGRPMAR